MKFKVIIENLIKKINKKDHFSLQVKLIFQDIQNIYSNILVRRQTLNF